MEENSTKTAKRIVGKPFVKGETGNPNGRPLGQKNYATLYKEALIKIATDNQTTPDAIELRLLSKGVANAIAGDYRFYKDILDRIHGTAIQKSDITTQGDKLSSQSDLDLELLAERMATKLKERKT